MTESSATTFQVLPFNPVFVFSEVEKSKRAAAKYRQMLLI
jgi:hypothetical protein